MFSRTNRHSVALAGHITASSTGMATASNDGSVKLWSFDGHAGRVEMVWDRCGTCVESFSMEHLLS